MSWIKITMKFDGNCIVCDEKVKAKEIGLWSKGVGVKHEKCAEIVELKCVICDNPAGCLQCEFQDNCDRSQVSQLCICKKCDSQKHTFEQYQGSIRDKYNF